MAGQLALLSCLGPQTCRGLHATKGSRVPGYGPSPQGGSFGISACTSPSAFNSSSNGGGEPLKAEVTASPRSCWGDLRGSRQGRQRAILTPLPVNPLQAINSGEKLVMKVWECFS